jgi:predicted RNase H-like HicB family nuclease
MVTSYTVVIQQDAEWWIGWVEEVPGVNSQGQTREELLENLRDALAEALEMNRAEASISNDELDPRIGTAMMNNIMAVDDKHDPHLESYQPVAQSTGTQPTISFFDPRVSRPN